MQVVDRYENSVPAVSVTLPLEAVPECLSLATVASGAGGKASTAYTLGTVVGANTLVVARETTALPDLALSAKRRSRS